MKLSKLLLILPTLCFIILLSYSGFAQDKASIENRLPGDGGGGGGSSCSCSDPVAQCSASVTCSGGGQAMCFCGSGGCSSYCAGGRIMGEFPDIKTLLTRLESSDGIEIANILTKTIGKTVSFTPYKENYRFDYNAQAESHWDILEYLSQNGDLKINGVDYKMWKRMREVLTSGKSSFCTTNATVGTLVNEITFFTGKKYQIAGGEANSKISINIKGLGIDGVIDELKKNNQLVVEQQ